ncbi:hypothetical protein GCM10027059_32720 [Myceligenerans halotolerans]
MEMHRTEDRLGIAHTWGTGPEVIFLSNPLADPVAWSAGVRDDLVARGHRVTTFEHRPAAFDWQSVVACVEEFVARRPDPVALVGWSQGAAIAQEVALASRERVRVAVLLATYGRQNEIDRILQKSWDVLAIDGEDCLRLALRLLTAFPPDKLADDSFVESMRLQAEWSERPDALARRRAAEFISTYQDRLPYLAGMTTRCLVVGFELDTDTFAARAQEVAEAIPFAEYIELTGLGHAAPFTDPDRVWPMVAEFLSQHHAPGAAS